MQRQSKLRSLARAVGIALTAMVVTATTAVATPAGASPGASDPFDVAAPTAAVTSNGPGQGRSIGARASYTVTLITGDVVHVTNVGGKSAVTIDPADPTSAVQTQTVGDDLYVFPRAALSYLATNRIDRDLFNVSLLIDNGYDDASRSSTPVILEYAAGRAPNARVAPPVGMEKTAVLESIDSAALDADKSEAAATWSDLMAAGPAQRAAGPAEGSSTWAHGIRKIWLDGIVKSTLDQSVPQIHAPEVWAAGYDGTGTKVAVLDSGVDATHPDLVERIDAIESFVPDETANDVNGHGTHVASTIAGTGAASDGLYKGTAPGVTLDVGKVLGDNGFGQDSWIIEGMEWAATQAPVVSMSVGSPAGSDGTDPMAQAVNEISADTGALFVIAAGNSYGGPIGSPGSADAALTVGAVDANDLLADFASVGPRLTDGALKPDISGPGVDITAARAKDSPGEGYYVDLSGTSMATPHVSGVAAMLLQADPDLTGQELKDILMSTSEPLETTAYQTGDGRVDAQRSILTDISATGSAFLGYFPWPHDADQVSKKTITYTNRGDTPMTLALTATFADLAGNAAADGLIELAADSVSVPAHGSATVDVSADPALAEVGTTYSGFVTATAGEEVVTRTAIGISKEAERYDLEINALDRAGDPMFAYVAVIPGNGDSPFPVEVNGQTSLRLPPGTYSVMSFADFETAPDSKAVALVGNPKVVLDRNRVVNLDLRGARRVSADVGRPTEATVERLDYFVDNGAPIGQSFLAPVDVDALYAAPTAWIGRSSFEFDARWRLRSPELQISLGGGVLDEIRAPGAPVFPDGTFRWKAVDAGTGSTEDLAAAGSLEGKLAIITRSADLTAYDRALAAHEAGAAALLVINDQPGEFNEGTWDPDFNDGPIPVAQISGVEGARVLAAVNGGRATATVQARFSSPFIYDLVDAHVGQIPRDLAYRPRSSDLARVDASYGAPRPQLGSEFRYDFRPWTPYGVGFLQYTAFPQQRVEWVSVQPGTSWYQATNLLDTQWEMRDIRRTYQAGRSYESHWYQPIVHPRLGEGFWTPNRQGDFIALNIPSESDGEPGHVGSIGDGVRNEVIEVYVGDELVASDDLFHYVGFEASPDPTTYRVVTTTETDPAVWPRSTSTRTEWSFTSTRSEEFSEVLPLLQLDYGIDTDLRGRASAGKTARFTLDASHLPGAVDTGTVRRGTLKVSFDDGRTWRSAELRGSHGHWTTTFYHPKRPGAFVSIRASASDAAGNTVHQQVIRAYRLK